MPDIPTPSNLTPSRVSARAGAAGADRVGDIVAACRLGADCAVLLGWSAEPITAEGTAARVGESAAGRFRAAVVAQPAPGEMWFVAALRAPRIGEAAGGKIRLLGAGRKTPTIAVLPDCPADPAQFAAQLAARLGPHLQEAVRFFLETFTNKASRQLEGAHAFLTALLDPVSEEDGVVEIVGPIEGEGVLIQGWMRTARAGELRVLMQGDGIDERAAAFATFERPDLETPALGIVALLRGDGSGAEDLKRVHLRANGRFLHLSVLPDVARLRPDDAPNHLRDMLPRLRAEAAAGVLRAAARPRYTGQDTVSTLNLPVRMAVDLAVTVPGAGTYLTGWLLDPDTQVAALWLRGRQGSRERLEPRFVRIPRRDVSDAFRADPMFHGRLDGNDRHGFAAFIPGADAWGALWIEIDLVDGYHAFLPVQTMSAATTEVKAQLFASVDLHKPSASEIIERCLGPLFCAAGDRPARPDRSGAQASSRARLLRPARAATGAALLVPIVAPDIRINIVVASLAARPPGASISILFVCTPAAVGDGSALLRSLAFYGLEAGVLLLREDGGAVEAIEAGMAALPDTESFLILSPTTHPLRSGWGEILLSALGDVREPAAASPTLLYEDWSVRYAGIDGLRLAECAPYAEPDIRAAGYPRGWSAEGDSAAEIGARPTLAAAIECCAVTRAGIKRACGFRMGYATAAAAGLDFFLTLTAAGGRVSWIPQCEAYALDEGESHASWAKVAEMTDGWILRERWGSKALSFAERLVGPVAESALDATVPPAAPVEPESRLVVVNALETILPKIDLDVVDTRLNPGAQAQRDVSALASAADDSLAPVLKSRTT